jgi:hypothetical protein
MVYIGFLVALYGGTGFGLSKVNGFTLLSEYRTSVLKPPAWREHPETWAMGINFQRLMLSLAAGVYK